MPTLFEFFFPIPTEKLWVAIFSKKKVENMKKSAINSYNLSNPSIYSVIHIFISNGWRWKKGTVHSICSFRNKKLIFPIAIGNTGLSTLYLYTWLILLSVFKMSDTEHLSKSQGGRVWYHFIILCGTMGSKNVTNSHYCVFQIKWPLVNFERLGIFEKEKA